MGGCVAGCCLPVLGTEFLEAEKLASRIDRGETGDEASRSWDILGRRTICRGKGKARRVLHVWIRDASKRRSTGRNLREE